MESNAKLVSDRAGVRTDRLRRGHSLRLLVLCHEYLPVGGGAAAVCHALSKQFMAAGHFVQALTMGYQDLPRRESIDGVDVWRIPCGRRRKDMASPGEGLRWAARCTRIARELHEARPFDLVHSHFIMPAGIVGDRLKRSAGIPHIITPHGSDVPGFNRERLRLVHRVVRPWWRAICRSADWIVSPSQSLLDLLSATTSEFCGTVVHNGFEVNRFKPRRKERRILLCSRLVERKGFHTFLQAIQPCELDGWKVDLVGDGPFRDHLASLAARCRVPVTMHGWLDNDSAELADLYERAMIFALPSERENCSVALLEAMSAGCAVISTNVSGNPEVLADCGVLVPPSDVGALRETVAALTGDPQRCGYLGQRALQRARSEFDWNVIGARYLDLMMAGGECHRAA